MRIGSRLFLGISALMCALMVLQWRLHTRQLEALEQELEGLTASVGRLMLQEALPDPGLSPSALTAPAGAPGPDTHPLPPLPEASAERTELLWVQTRANGSPGTGAPPPAHATPATAGTAQLEDASSSDAHSHTERRVVVVRSRLGNHATSSSDPDLELRVQSIDGDQLMVIRGLPGGERRIAIPARGAADVVQATREQSLLLSGILLCFGLMAAALFSHRITRPLRQLVAGTETLGSGALEHRLPEDGPGELGDLQAAFNRMATQLQQLAEEQAHWQSREHLAVLGELARGLAHTLRNPLNTLGLAIEELAEPVRLPVPGPLFVAPGVTLSADSGPTQSERTNAPPPDPALEPRRELVAVARAQIQRIDRWLRSFLAIGAGEASTPAPLDLVEIVQDLVLESLQQGREAQLELPTGPVWVPGIQLGLRAALSNLLENAFEASPDGAPVTLRLEQQTLEAVLTILDRGPGLAPQVRTQLFSPHVTTRPGGSGMGLFLARQIIEGGHRGTLELQDRCEGGTEARVHLPLYKVRPPGEPQHSNPETP